MPPFGQNFSGADSGATAAMMEGVTALAPPYWTGDLPPQALRMRPGTSAHSRVEKLAFMTLSLRRGATRRAIRLHLFTAEHFIESGPGEGVHLSQVHESGVTNITTGGE